MKIPERLPHSLHGLRMMINYIKANYDIKTVIEIGSWTGLSAVEFAKNFDKVYCIDPWEATGEINTEYDMKEVEKIFDNRIKDYDNIIKIKATSADARGSSLLPKKADLIYIDGLHNYDAIRQDITLWKDKITKLITGHDYWPNKFDGVIKAVNEALGKPDKIFSDTSWIKEI